MSDAKTRKLERSDEAADLQRLRHQRCRQGECCAHAGETVPLGALLYDASCCGDEYCYVPVRLRMCHGDPCASCCDEHVCRDAKPGRAE